MRARNGSLVIEVSDVILVTDQAAKCAAYAKNGLTVCGIVIIAEGQVEVYNDPDPAATPPAYGTRTSYRPGRDVTVYLAGVAPAVIPAADLLP